MAVDIAELTGWRRTAVRMARFVEPDGDPSEVIYGTLIAAAVLATKAHKGESAAVVFWAAVLVLGLYWAAHVYADVLGERLDRQARPGWRHIISTAVTDLSMLRGSFGPIFIFGLVRICGASVNTAGLSAVWSTVVLLGCWGLIAAARGGARGLELLAETLVCATLGFAVVALKIFVH